MIKEAREILCKVTSHDDIDFTDNKNFLVQHLLECKLFLHVYSGIIKNMNKKIKVALIYKRSNDFMTGSYFASTYFHFFKDALKRNEKLAVTYFPADNTFDTNKIGRAHV